MKTTIKMFTCAVIAASFMLLSCSDTKDDEQTSGKLPVAGCKQIVSALELPDDISPSCQGENKKLVIINDGQEIEEEPASGSYSCNEDRVCGITLNGEIVSMEEYNAYMEDYWRRREERINEAARDLEISCSVKSGDRSWIALLTEREISDLQEKYDDIYVFPYEDDKLAGGNANEADSKGNNMSCL